MIKITGIHHYAIVSGNMEHSVAFYRDVLGLQEIPLPVTFGPVGIRARWFAIGDGQLHIIDGNEPGTPSRRHVALMIEDAGKAREILHGKGFAVKETTPIPGFDRFFTFDPDGHRVELIQAVK